MTIGGCLFVFVSFNNDESPYGPYPDSPGRLAWLQGLLDANQDKSVIVFIHIQLEPVRSGGGAQNYWYGSGVLGALEPVLESHPGQVGMVLAGHAHVADSFMKNGILYATAPALNAGEFAT